MKIPNIFFILGGGSQDVLDKITTLREHEKRRISNVGMLLLIPVLFAGLGMFYTLSIYTNNYYIMIIGSLIWCYAIFVIDSSFIINLRKSRHNQTGFWYYVGIALRLAMACLIGYLISHQLLFYIFKENIDAKISEMNRQEKTIQVEKSRNDLKNARAELENAQMGIKKEIQKYNNQIQCLSNLISLEQSYKGDEPKEVTYNGEHCGYASGKGASCEGRCKGYISEKDRLISERNNLIAKQKEIEQSRNNEIEALSQILVNDEKILAENKPVNSILQKDKALNELVKENSAVSRMYWALLLLFMIIDTLVVIVKLTSPMGMYEHTMDAMIEENKAILKAEENANVLYAKTVAEEEALIVAKHLGIAKSISVLANIPLRISKDIRETIDDFREHIKESRTVSNKKIDINTKVEISKKYEELYLKLIDKAFKEIEKE